jgi:sensor domain CHASE-containing protein
MRLREKTLIIIIVIFAILILIEFAVSDLIVMNSYYSLERQDTLQKVYQAWCQRQKLDHRCAACGLGHAGRLTRL